MQWIVINADTKLVMVLKMSDYEQSAIDRMSILTSSQGSWDVTEEGAERIEESEDEGNAVKYPLWIYHDYCTYKLITAVVTYSRPVHAQSC